MRIAILGYSASGKSTLARKLAQKYNCPVQHLDKLQFKSGWVVREKEEKAALMRAFLDENESWVIDGNYKALYQEERLEKAELIVLMQFNRFACLARVIKRYLRYKNTTRPDMSEGCNEKLDFEFVKWILKDGRTAETRRHYADVAKKYPAKTIVIKTQRQLDAFCGSQGLTIGI